MVGEHHRHRPVGLLRGVLHFVILTAVLMGVGALLERLREHATFDYLARQQSLAVAAVASINPLDMFDRYLCALRPSVEELNRRSRGVSSNPRYAFLGQAPVASDCRYALSRAAPAPGNVLPPPVVGHWADGTSGLVQPFLALLDTAWHLIAEPSVFSSIFAIFIIVAGGMAAGTLMALARFNWPPLIGPTVFAMGTIAAGCLIAWCLKEVMAAGLYAFGSITHLAAVCCGASSIVVFVYHFVLKMIETGIHMGAEKIVP